MSIILVPIAIVGAVLGVLVDDSRQYISGQTLPDGYLGLMDGDEWIEIPPPENFKRTEIRFG